MGAGAGAALGAGKAFNFTKAGTFLDKKVSANITVTADAAAAQLIEDNQPFGPGTTQIASLKTGVSGGTGNISFLNNKNDVVSFSGSAGFDTGIAVYDDASKLLQDLDPKNTILQGIKISGLALKDESIAQFMVLDWGYNISASVNGGVALGGSGSVSFGADGSNQGFFAVIRGYSKAPGAQDGIADLIGSWRLPNQVKTVDDLKPATWIIAEVDGSLDLSLGAKYGYDYNWIRKVTLGDGTGALSGAIGLKIQAAAEVTLGFHFSGKNLVVLGRESIDPAKRAIRVRLYRMRKKGWDFALNASVGVTPSTGTLTPAKLSDFISGLIKGVAGTAGPQIIADLQEFEKWTDPGTSLPDIFSKFVADYATKELGALPAVQQIEAARAKIDTFLKNWSDPGTKLSSMLWSAVEKAGTLPDDLIKFLQNAKGASTADDLKTLIAAELGKVGFFSSPVGEWLQSVAPDGLVTLLNDIPGMQQVQSVASKVLDIADGKVLDNLVAYVKKELDITQIQNVLDQASLDKLDPWLQKKLSDFVGKTVVFEDLAKIKTTIDTIEKKAQNIYEEAVKALNTTYAVSFNYTYSSTTTDTALIDVSFDFSQDPGLGAMLSSALGGDFTSLLLANTPGGVDRPGIVMNSATLTHGVNRQTHVQIALPHWSRTIDEINQALTTMTVQADASGRLFLYDLNASDAVTLQEKWKSSLAITGKLPMPAGVRNFASAADLEKTMTFSYGFLQATKAMREAQLINQVKPLVANYFPNAFSGPDRAPIEEWADDLDHFASAASQAATGAPNATGALFDTLLQLNVSLPGTVVAAWMKAPGRNDPDQSVYLTMSRNLQAMLRQFTAYCYFDDPSKYVATSAAMPIVFYQALAVMGNFTLNPDGSMSPAAGITWYNFSATDFSEIDAVLDSGATRRNWDQIASGIRGVLADNPALRKSVGLYPPSTSWGPARNQALANQTLQNLLAAETKTITAARQAGWDMADFMQSGSTDPDRAMQALTDFGATVTKAFNDGLGGVFGGRTANRIREFSALIFLEAAKAFDPALRDVKPLARLDVFLLRPSAPANTIANFLNGTNPDASAVAIEQPVMGLPD